MKRQRSKQPVLPSPKPQVPDMACDFTDPLFLFVAGATVVSFLAMVLLTTSALSCICIMNGRLNRFTGK